MDLEIPRFDFAELCPSLPKCEHFIACKGSVAASYYSRQHLTNISELEAGDLETTLIQAIVQDDKARLINQSKRVFGDGGSNRSRSSIDRSLVSKLLHLCCLFDAVDCATSLINGELGVVPLVNELDDTGKSPLHVAAEEHAARCVELLLKKHARTDLKTRDGRAQLALELSLSLRGMEVVWNPDEFSVEDLLILLSKKDLTTVKLLSGKTKEIHEVAYASATEGRIVSLATLLVVAAEKVNESTLVLCDADLGVREKTTIYECVIREALSLGRVTTSSRSAKWTSMPTKAEAAERRRLLLCEIELLQHFGAVARGGFADRKVTSPLIRACQAGDEAIVELLLKTNIDVNDADAEGNSALHWSLKLSRALCLKQIKIVGLLLKHGAQVSQRNKLGLTAAHIAASNGDSHALQVLLLEDPDCVNSKTEMNETPLFFAVKNDHMDCAELLLHQGANSEVLNLRKQRPIDFAKTQDMRFMLSPTNINLMNRTFSIPQKYNAWLQDGGVISDGCESLLILTEEGTTPGRISSSTKTEICKYFRSQGGCIRGSSCFYAHGDQELQKVKPGKHLVLSPAAQELKRKIFVGGLPPLIDSELLGKIFEEQFGSVENARVVGVHVEDQIESRGIGFVTFKNEKSVSAAIEAHCVTIMGKQVEIKSVVPKCLLLPETQKLSPQRDELVHNDQYQPKARTPTERTTEERPSSTQEAKSEKKSWVDKVLEGQPKISPNESQGNLRTSLMDQRMPIWLGTFRKWFPKFLKEASMNPKEGEYPLSSLKGDFRAAFGLELDHASLGYSKLSEFVRSFPDICSMKVVPTGKHGPANHMVLVPIPPRPHWQLLQPPPRCSPLSFAVRGFQYFHLLSSEQGGPVSSSNEGSPSHLVPEDGDPPDAAPENNSVHGDMPNIDYSRFLEFLNPDPLLRRAWIQSPSGGAGGSDDGGRKEAESSSSTGASRKKHAVLEFFARKKDNTSLYFLREFDFRDNYQKSVAEMKCFLCNREMMFWSNLPCRHRLWCDSCRSEVKQAAANFEHKCVICDKLVQTMTKNVPWDEDSKHMVFPALDASFLRSPNKKRVALR